MPTMVPPGVKGPQKAKGGGGKRRFKPGPRTLGMGTGGVQGYREGGLVDKYGQKKAYVPGPRQPENAGPKTPVGDIAPAPRGPGNDGTEKLPDRRR